MQPFKELEYGNFYHIYNHGVGGRDLFLEPENYEYFLGLYDKYILPVAETYAWCLMPNHFHLLVRIKEEVDDVTIVTPDRVRNPVRGNIPSLQFSKLFNSYAQAYNKYHETRGALFERPFKRKLIDNLNYRKEVVVYIHCNPIHHGFCTHPVEYPWSSYLTCTSDKATKLKRDEVIGWFGGKDEYEEWHKKKTDMHKMDWELGID
jgi:putative transposase